MQKYHVQVQLVETRQVEIELDVPEGTTPLMADSDKLLHAAAAALLQDGIDSNQYDRVEIVGVERTWV
jgi:hypothetical protein